MLATRVVSCGNRRISATINANRLLRFNDSTKLVKVNVRFLSSEDVFGRFDLSKATNLPDLPSPPIAKPSIEELAASGQSVLEELGLWSWHTPPSWFRYAFETIHVQLDLPWWTTIVVSTIALRLLLIKVTVMSQRSIAIQSRYKPELNRFRERIADAQSEGNNQLVQQILLEQRDFYRSKDIRIGRQFLVMLANGSVFMTNFFAIRKMANAGYPGFENGGALWFTDLTACDPYYILPAISALTLGIVVKLGVEFGASSDQLTPAVRAGMQYGLPLIVLVSSSQFASALCVYWCTTNAMSLFYSGLFQLTPVRNFFNIPPIVKHDLENQSLKSSWTNYRAGKKAPPTIGKLRRKDMEEFKKAGRGQPKVSE
ncbi:Mitochondrial inner membrane protein OXA1L [Aphelenchoides besseyi]|nr:Mitochondrial inner membrane protein OXA1L [Aphelenchoides besseyi]